MLFSRQSVKRYKHLRPIYPVLYEKSKHLPLIQRRLTTVDLQRKSAALSRFSRSNHLNFSEASLNSTVEELKVDVSRDDTADMFFDALDD